MMIGQNVALRPVAPDDAPVLTNWYNDPAFMGRYFNHATHTRQFWEQRIAVLPGTNELDFNLIVRPDLTEPMGVIVAFNPFTYVSLYRGLEIGYLLDPRHRGRGVATQAACLLVNHLFGATPTERIQANVVVGNDESCRVLERAGMQRDGLYRRVMFLHGRYVDMHHYAIVRENWGDEHSYRQGREF
jgi:[ribosomal protein S5]-alanine N-acetyltransferase